MSNAQELACTYACLILSDDGIPITSDKISAVLMVAKVSVESYWPPLFAKLADQKRNIEDLVLDITLGGGGGGGSAAHATGAGVVADVAVLATQAKEEKKEKIFEESDDNIMPSLFDD